MHKVLSGLTGYSYRATAWAGKEVRAPPGWRISYDKLKKEGGYLRYWAECLACNGDVIAGRRSCVAFMSFRPAWSAEWALLHGNCRCAQPQGSRAHPLSCQLPDSQQSYCMTARCQWQPATTNK